MKTPFVTKAQIEEIVKTYPTPFHIYDEKGIRENARKIKAGNLHGTKVIKNISQSRQLRTQPS